MIQERAMTTTELGARGEHPIALTPSEIVANASNQAKVLMDIVTQTKCFQVIGGRQYLQVEAWETIGAFNWVHAVTEWIHPIERNGELVGYDAKVNLVNINGIIVGSAIMPCYFSENVCRGREGDARDKACKSAAQTFATSKAYRLNYAYVAILAGYEPTPAEEMTGDSSDVKPPKKIEHWCLLHHTPFFKRGKMKTYAHPIVDEKGKSTGKWCNEGEVDSGKTKEQAEAQTAPDNGEKETEGEPELVPVVDMERLKDSLEKLGWADVGGYLRRTYGVSGAKISDMVQALNQEQAAEFVAEVKDRLAML